MASNELYLNTWYAKRIMGDSAASSYDDALLQTGANIAADTWIFNQTEHSASATTLYGIKYVYDSGNDADDALEYYGGKTVSISGVTTAIPSVKMELTSGSIWSGSIYPRVTNTYDLGSTNLGWQHIYICGTTSNSHALDGTNPYIEFSNSERTQYGRLIYTHFDAQGGAQSLAFVGNSGNTDTRIKAASFSTNVDQKCAWNDEYAGIVLHKDGTMHLSQGQSSTATDNNGGYIGFHYNGSTSTTSLLQGINGAMHADPRLVVGGVASSGTVSYQQLLGGRTSTKTDFCFAVVGNGFIRDTIYSNIGVRVHRSSVGGGFQVFQTDETSEQLYAVLQADVFGTTSAQGRATLKLGNSLKYTTDVKDDKNASGRIQMYQASDNSCWYYPESWTGSGKQSSYTFLGATSDTNGTEAFTYLILGNNKSVDSTDAHSEGRFRIYGNLTYYHDIRSGSALAKSSDTYQAAQASADSDNRTHYLPNASGYLITVNTKAAITMDNNKWTKADWNTGTTYLVSTTTYGTGYITDIARIARRVYVTVNEETGKIPTGYSQILLGNNIAAESAANAYGSLVLYGTGTKYTNLRTAQTTADNTMYLPNYNGTGYLVHTSGTAAVGGQYAPVYIAANGRVTEITAGTTAQFYRGDKSWSNDLAGRLTVDGLSTSADIIFDSIGGSGTTGTSGKITWSGSTDAADIYYYVPTSDQGNLVFNTRDDTNCLLAFAYNGTINAYINNSTPSFYPQTTNTGTIGTSTYEWSNTYTRGIYARHFDASYPYTSDRNMYYGYNKGANHYFYSMDGTTRTHLATLSTDFTVQNGYLKSTKNGNTVSIGSQNNGFCHITNSADIPFWFNKSIQMETGKVIGGAGTAYRPFQLYLGRYHTSGSNALNADSPLIEFSNSDRSQYCQLIYDDYDSLVAPDSLTLVGNQNGIKFILKNGPIWIQGGSNAGGNVNRLDTTSGMPGNMTYNSSRRGTQIYSNGIAFCDPYNGNSNSDAGWIRHLETTGNSGTLEIAVGDDGNEVVVVRQYKTDNTINRTLTLLNASGYMLLPSYINVPTSNNENPTVSQFIVTNGSDHYYRKASVAHVASAVDGQHKWVRIGGDTMTSTLTLSGGSVNVQQGHVWAGTNGNTSGERQVGVQSGAGRLYMYSVASTSGNRGLYGANKAGTAASYLYIQQDNYVRCGTRLYGAVWNDYAEFRLGQMNGLKPGQIVTENGDGTMRLASKRLQKGCKVLSDTYGFALGETNEYKLPIAVSGRVLVYCDTPIEELEPGDCLCSNITGNAIKMTREEIINYPDCIIGTVSEIPTYDIWHCGDQTNENGMKEEIWVNGRIWIYVK